jgi:hypothetical protein
MEDASPKSDPERIARRYYKTAAEYVGLARGASSPSLRVYFARIAEEYIVRADARCGLPSAARLAPNSEPVAVSPGQST